MIAVTISFFGEWKTKTQLEAEIEFGLFKDESHEINRIDKSNPHWSTFVFKNHEDSIQWIDKCKKLKTFSCVVAIQDLDSI
jgi:hypothetical protein